MTNETVSDDELADWQSWDCEIGDKLSLIFHEKGVFDFWPDVEHEAMRVYSLMFNDGVEIESDSPLDHFFLAVCSACSNVTVDLLAKAIGIHPFDLGCALERWELDPDKPAAGWDGFRELVEAVDKK